MQENQNNNNEVEELDLNHLMQIRRDKLKDLQEQGKNPFEITKFNRTNTAGEIKSNWKIWRKGCNSNRKNNCQKNNGKSIILYNTR